MNEWSDTHLVVGAWRLLDPALGLLKYFGNCAGIDDELREKYGHPTANIEAPTTEDPPVVNS
jgi:hypothetical protein